MDHTQYTTNGAERKPGTHLTMEDRGAIQAMKKLGHSNRAIARYLHCAPSTIFNELKRGTPPRTGSRGRAPGYAQSVGTLCTRKTERIATSRTALTSVRHLFSGSSRKCVRKSGLLMPVSAMPARTSSSRKRRWSAPKPFTMRYGAAICPSTSWNFPKQ